MRFENPLAKEPDAKFDEYYAKGAYKRCLHRLHMMSLKTIKALLESGNPVLVDRANYHLASRLNKRAPNKMGRPPKDRQQATHALDPMEQYEKLMEEANVDSSGEAPAEGLEPQSDPGGV